MTTALAHPNIAFIKYWGNRDQRLRLPTNGSISMNLGGLYARTQVAFDPELCCDDVLNLNGKVESAAALRRVSSFLEHVRQMAGTRLFATAPSNCFDPKKFPVYNSATSRPQPCLSGCLSQAKFFQPGASRAQLQFGADFRTLLYTMGSFSTDVLQAVTARRLPPAIRILFM